MASPTSIRKQTTKTTTKTPWFHFVFFFLCFRFFFTRIKRFWSSFFSCSQIDVGCWENLELRGVGGKMTTAANTHDQRKKKQLNNNVWLDCEMKKYKKKGRQLNRSLWRAMLNRKGRDQQHHTLRHVIASSVLFFFPFFTFFLLYYRPTDRTIKASSLPVLLHTTVCQQNFW